MDTIKYPYFDASSVSAKYLNDLASTWNNEILASEYKDALSGEGNYIYCMEPQKTQYANILGRECYRRYLF